MSYPVPCIDVQDIRALREKIYLCLMGTNTRVQGEDGGMCVTAIQKDLLSYIGIGGWTNDVWPALNDYFDRIESVQDAYALLHNTQTTCLDSVGSDNPVTEGTSQIEATMPLVRVRGPGEQGATAASPYLAPIKSILKTSSSSMSAQSFSTYASSYGSNSELLMHPLARELSGLDDQELLRLGLALPADNGRSNQASFDSSTASPRALANLRAQLLLGAEFQTVPSAQAPCFPSPSLPSASLVQTPAGVNSEDDVFGTAPTQKGKDKADMKWPDPKLEDGSQQDHGSPEISSFPSLQALKPTKSTMTLKDQPENLSARTPSERTMKLIKSSWKSTEGLFAKFRAQEQGISGAPGLPICSPDGLRSFSQRRPSKSVRFSDEEMRVSEKASEVAPERATSEKNSSTANGTAAAGQQRENPPRPTDPWQYTRDYLLEKIKAEQEGRQCALTSPSPDWFAELDGSADRQSTFVPKFGRDAITKLVSNVAAAGSGGTSSFMRTVSSDSSASARMVLLAMPDSVMEPKETRETAIRDMTGLKQVAVKA